MTPHEALIDRTARFGIAKSWMGDLAGTGHGVMLSAGDPGAGEAGYVAVETVEGTLHDRSGGLAFAQLGLMCDGASTLRYVVVPGSGYGELAGITGELTLRVEEGVHRYELAYSVAG